MRTNELKYRFKKQAMEEFKSDKEFDKLFRNSLNADSITPSDKVWENIDSELDRETKKPLFIFWLSLFIGIILIGIVSFLITKEPKSVNTNIANSTAHQKTSFDNRKFKNDTDSNSPNKKTKASQSESTSSDITDKLLNNNTGKNSLKRNNLAASDKKNHKKTAAVLEKEIKHLPFKEKKNSKKAKAENSVSKSISSTTNSFENENAKEDKIEKNIFQNKVQGPDSVITITKDGNQHNLRDNITEITDTSSNKKIVIISENLIHKKDSLITHDSIKTAKDTVLKNNIVDTNSKQSYGIIDSTKQISSFPVFAIYGYYGLDYFYSQSSSTEKNFNPSTEKQLNRFSVGLKFDYRPKQMLGFQLGCFYSELKQEKESSVVRFSKYITEPYSIYSSLGEMKVDANVMLAGYTLAGMADTIGFKATYKQEIKFINIPINVKLNLLKKNINVYILAGLNSQIAIKQKSTLNILKETFTTTIVYNDVKVNRLYFSALFGVGAEWRVYRRLGIFIEPTMRYGLSNLSKTPGIKTRPIVVGANAGINITF